LQIFTYRGLGDVVLKIAEKW